MLRSTEIFPALLRFVLPFIEFIIKISVSCISGSSPSILLAICKWHIDSEGVLTFFEAPLAWGTAWEALWGLLAFDPSSMGDRLGGPLGAAGFWSL